MKIIKLILLFVVLMGCSKKETPVVVTKPPVPKVIQMEGMIVSVEASDIATQLISPIIKNELDEIVADNKELKIIGNNDIVVSKDNISFSNEINILTNNGKVHFYIKTNNNIAGLYKIQIKSPDTPTAFANYFINILPSSPHSLGLIYTNRYEDKMPLNNMKDANENYSIISDGNNTGYITLSGIKDKFGNNLSNIRTRVIIDRGEIVSENPTISIDGTAVFNILTDGARGSVNVKFEILDQHDNVILAKDGIIDFVSQNIEIFNESFDYGQVILNDSVKKTFIIKNTGNMMASNLSYIVRSPFNIINEESTCFGKTKLYPDEHCSLTIKFIAGVRDLFESEFSVFSSPNYTPNANNSNTLRAHAVAPPLLTPELSLYDFETKQCGTQNRIATYIKNNGDLAASTINVLPFKQLSTYRDNYDITLEFPPADPILSPDLNDIVNCGDTFLPNRKCRVYINYNPTALESTNIFNGKLEYNNQSSSFNVRVHTVVGEPSGTIPLKLTNPDASNPDQEISAIISSSSVRTRINIGPIKDACQNIVEDGKNVVLTSTKGTLVQSSGLTNFGFLNIDWRGSDNPDDIGLAQVIAQSGEAIGSAILQYDGIKLKISGNNDLGQILTKKPQSYIFNITNEGTIPANNLFIDLSYKKSLDLNNDGINEKSPWGILDPQYQGGCQDGILLAGETCSVKLILNTQNFGVGLFDGEILASSTEYGKNNVAHSFIGRSELPPILTLSESNYDYGIINASPFFPTKTFTLTNEGPAIAYNLNIQSQFPFVVTNNTCQSQLSGTVGENTCLITVELQAKIVGTYSGVLNVVSEFSSTNLNMAAKIIPGIAGGLIPIAFDKISVPSDRNSLINVVIGPLVDDYGNQLPQGTPIEISTDAGVMSIDPNLDGTETVLTNSQGVINFSIRSKTLDEVKAFNINAKIYNNTNLIAQGTKQGSFTGGILNFPDTQIDFGDITIGVVITQTFPLKNEGSEVIDNLVFNTSNSYFNIVDYGDCNGSVKKINPGQTCLITVSFFPPFEGGVSSTLSVSGSGNGVLSDSILLNGVAVLPAKLRFALNPIQINIPATTAYTGNMIIYNEGNESVSSVMITSSEYSNFFNFNYSNCLMIGAQSSCTIPYTFNPTNLGSSIFESILTVSAESPSLSVSANTNFIANPHSLVLNTTFSSLYAEECTNVSIRLIDANSNFVNAPVSFNVSLESNLPGSFYDGTNCSGSTILTKTFMSGQNNISNISFKASSIGNFLLKATNPLLLNEPALINVEKLTLTATPPNNPNLIANVNECLPIVLQIKNNAGVLYNIKSNILFNLSSSLSGTFWTNSSCSSPNINTYMFASGTHTQTLYYKPNEIGNNTVSISNNNINNIPKVFQIINFASVETITNNSMTCKQGSITIACPPSIGSNGLNRINLLEKDVTTNVINGTSTLVLDNTSGLSVGQFFIIKTKPNNTMDSARMFKQEYGYITSIINSTNITVSNTLGNALSIPQNGTIDQVKLIIIPELNFLYLKNGTKIVGSSLNYSNGNNGFIGMSIKNKIMGEKSTPINSINSLNGVIYGDGITIYSTESNDIEIQGGL